MTARPEVALPARQRRGQKYRYYVSQSLLKGGRPRARPNSKLTKPCGPPPYQSVRSRSTDFGRVGFEPGQMPTTLKSAFYLGF